MTTLHVSDFPKESYVPRSARRLGRGTNSIFYPHDDPSKAHVFTLDVWKLRYLRALGKGTAPEIVPTYGRHLALLGLPVYHAIVEKRRPLRVGHPAWRSVLRETRQAVEQFRIYPSGVWYMLADNHDSFPLLAPFAEWVLSYDSMLGFDVAPRNFTWVPGENPLPTDCAVAKAVLKYLWR